MSQQVPTTLSLPIDPLTVAANYFSLQRLELSFHFLRSGYPTLALAVQNLTAEARLNRLNNCEDQLLPVKLDVQLVSDIVCALSCIAEQAAESSTRDKDTMIAIHQTLLDWLLYAQSFLDEEPEPIPPLPTDI